MADAFSYFLPDGTPVNGSTVAPPAGVAAYTSAALVPDQNGALTSTAQGDAANAFRGFVSADGGGFGGYTGPKPVSIQSQLEDPTSNITAPNDPHFADKIRQGMIDSGVLNPDGTQRAFGPEGFTPTPNKVRPVPVPSEGFTATPNKVNPVPSPYDAFSQQLDTVPTEGAVPLQGGVQSVPNQPPPVTEGFRQFTGRTFNGPQDAGGGAAPMFPQSAWSGGSMAPSAGSAARPALMGGRFGRFQQMGGSQIAQKMRQRFKPLGAPANGLTPGGSGGVGAPTNGTTNVF